MRLIPLVIFMFAAAYFASLGTFGLLLLLVILYLISIIWDPRR